MDTSTRNRPITLESRVAIRPCEVAITAELLQCFGEEQYRHAASAITTLIGFAQKQGGWFAFSRTQLNCFRNEFWGPCATDFNFGNLIADGYIVERDGRFHFTYEFVSRVYTSSPIA